MILKQKERSYILRRVKESDTTISSSSGNIFLSVGPVFDDEMLYDGSPVSEIVSKLKEFNIESSKFISGGFTVSSFTRK